MGYLPIESYGLIGDCRTAALAGVNGSIDWFCYPRFDSPSVFASLLDDRRGGYFRIHAGGGGRVTKQFYWPDTNVLVTRFFSENGIGQIIDFMPMPCGEEGPRIIRRASSIKGEVEFALDCRPAFNYARERHEVEVRGTQAIFRSPSLTLSLRGEAPLHRHEQGVRAHFSLKEAEQTSFELAAYREGEAPRPPAEIDRWFERTVQFWRRWLRQSRYRGRWRETVNRAALVQKLLIYEPTGAMVAAPTTSLPESIGGPRNWDYRYTWVRDSAFTVYSLLRLGFTQEAARFMDWVDARCREVSEGRLDVLYGIDGSAQFQEEILDLDGYRGSRPVRIGNAAHDQLQLDIYGELMDAAYLTNKYGRPVSYEQWEHLRRLTDWVAANWERQDEGIWEVRSGSQNFVYSKVMCWVCLDRALRLSQKRSLPCDGSRWRATRDAIYENVQANGWNPKRESFAQFYGSDSLDASLLMMPLVFFMAPNDPRMVKTLEAIDQPRARRGLVTHGLVYRYNPEETPDGFTGGEGTFNACSFWLVEAMARAGVQEIGRLYRARLLFEEMLGSTNHLGLFAEQTGPNGEALGNYPQALTHMALISAAFDLDRQLDAAQSCGGM